MPQPPSSRGPGPSYLRGLHLIPSSEPFSPRRVPYTGCRDRGVDVLGEPQFSSLPAEPGASAQVLSLWGPWALSSASLLLLFGGGPRVFAASHARLFSLNVPSLLEECGVI